MDSLSPQSSPPTQIVIVQPHTQGLSARAQLIRRAASRIPTTAEDLPVGFYRVDLLPIDGFVDTEMGGLEQINEGTEQNSERVPADTEQDIALSPNASTEESAAVGRQVQEVQALRAAYVELSYEHGYPTLPGGELFWHKLDYEPGLAYGVFQIYLEQTSGDSEDSVDGVRDLSTLADNAEFLSILKAHRQQETAPTKAEVLAILTEFHVLYFWRARSKAYDLYQEAAYRHKRIKRAMSAEDHHYRLSVKVLQVVEEYLGSKKFEDGLSPKTALDALSKLVAIQRVSVGLPAAGPLAAKDAAPATQFEAILRQIGAQSATASSASSQPGMGSRQTNDTLDKMLRDPDTTKTMQELIIRVTTSNQVPQEVRRTGGRIYDAEAAAGAEDATLAEDIKFHQL